MPQPKSDFDLTNLLNKNKNYARLVLARGATFEKSVAWVKDKTRTKADNYFSTLDNRELFLHGFFEKLGNVERVFEQLELILNCFYFPPSKQILKKWNTKKTAIMEYHLENYYHRVYTFRESVYQLINFLYFLKISEYEVNRNTIEQKFKPTHQFYDERIKKIIDDINELFKPMNDKRKQSVHYGKFNESSLTLLKILEQSGINIDNFNKLKGEASKAKDLLGDLFLCPRGVSFCVSHVCSKGTQRFNY